MDAALRLFAERGYDATSIEDVTTAAGVSPRTFFRYFETKDRILFFGGDDFARAVAQSLTGQAAVPDDLAAVAAGTVSLAPTIEPLHARIALYFAALETSNPLMGQHYRAMARHNGTVATALARRRGRAAADERALLAAAMSSIVVERACRRWVAGEGALVALLEEGFDLVREVAAGAT